MRVAGSKISQSPATAPDFTLLQVGGHFIFCLCLEGIRINWERGVGSARSGVIIEVVANGLIPSNPDRHPYVSFTTSTVKSRWDPHGRNVLNVVASPFLDPPNLIFPSNEVVNNS